jgi:hypothetical protein
MLNAVEGNCGERVQANVNKVMRDPSAALCLEVFLRMIAKSLDIEITQAHDRSDLVHPYLELQKPNSARIKEPHFFRSNNVKDTRQSSLPVANIPLRNM